MNYQTMFKKNEKIAKKLNSELFPCTYLKERKEFLLIMDLADNKEIPEVLLKEFKKLDLEIKQIRKNPETLGITLKRKPEGQKWIIRTLSFTMFAIALQLAFIASKTVFYFK